MSDGRRIGFVGHRDLRRMGCDAATLRRLVIAAAAGLRGSTRAELPLISGVAEGADSLAITVWHEQGFGPVHGLYPDSAARAQAIARGDHARLDTHMVLPATADSPHLALATIILEHAQHLLALYDGQPGRGPGGTADSIARARARAMPVTIIACTPSQGSSSEASP